MIFDEKDDDNDDDDNASDIDTQKQRVHNLTKNTIGKACHEQWWQLLSNCSHHLTIINSDSNDKENDPDQWKLYVYDDSLQNPFL